MSELKSILRFEKIKSFQDLGKSNAHVYRYSNTLNANEKIKNKIIFGNGNIVKSVKDKIKKHNLKTRANSVICIETLLTLSPEFFENNKKEKINEFAKEACSFLTENFKDELVSIVLHLDESTPHIHAHFVPMIKDNDGYKLCAKERLTKITLRNFQKNYNEKMKKINPNISYKAGSNAKHQDIKAYYEIVNSKTNPLKEEIELLKKNNLENLLEASDILEREYDKNVILEKEIIMLKKENKQKNEEINNLNKTVNILRNQLNKLKKAYNYVKQTLNFKNENKNEINKLKMELENEKTEKNNIQFEVKKIKNRYKM